MWHENYTRSELSQMGKEARKEIVGEALSAKANDILVDFIGDIYIVAKEYYLGEEEAKEIAVSVLADFLDIEWRQGEWPTVLDVL